jgi:hypothetical protein
LRLVIACFPACAAVVATVLAQTRVILAEADSAVAIAGALLLVFLANDTLKPGGFHYANLAPRCDVGKVTEVRSACPSRNRRGRKGAEVLDFPVQRNFSFIMGLKSVLQYS